MGDTITAWHDMQEENEKKYINRIARDNGLYIFVLDFGDGQVYRYDVSALCNESNGWNPDSESCEAFLVGAGHNISNCEWMVTSNKTFEHGN